MDSATSTELTPRAASSAFERRLSAEWDLLSRLKKQNKSRLKNPRAEDSTFWITLFDTPALTLNSDVVTEHPLRIVYPRYFPSVPLEVYLDTPVLHPNIHPSSGFVCLWNTHRIHHNIEHALHKTAAILGWQLENLDPRQVMQQDAAHFSAAEKVEIAHRLLAPPLRGLDGLSAQLVAPVPFRSRLS